jgi:uncharacterized protein (UPF0262 family)
LEKIHGTSAYVSWTGGAVKFFSGGESHEKFVGLFDIPNLTARFLERFTVQDTVTVFGEAYGGKQQGMSGTYGKDLKFVAFDVKVGDLWLKVPDAESIAKSLGLEFVDYELVSTDMEVLNAHRDAPSVQAMRNGIPEPRPREGVVLRPMIELALNTGRRVIAKHKGEAFSEFNSKPKTVSVDTAGVEEQLFKWVTSTRLEHVIDTVISIRDNKEVSIEDTFIINRAMLDDITRESVGELEITPAVKKGIGRETVKLFKKRLNGSIVI